jgi:RNA-directed DNA polymerase
MKLFKEIGELNFNTFKSSPVKRIYIPKANGKLRPIGIPNLKERVLQQIIKNALEPEWEARFESSSYGFRPSRSVNDAINRIFLNLTKPNCRTWVVDADITGCFDNISHETLTNNIQHFPTPGLYLIKQWLKSGIIDENVFFTTETGTPQGSIISPLLSNIALHGMEKELGIRTDDKGYVKHGDRSYIRYADDFVILCYTKKDADIAKKELEQILARRGLTLNEKTKVCHITDGFDFLGFNIKVSPQDGYRSEDVIIHKSNDNIYYDYQKTLLLISPSEKSIEKYKKAIKEVFIKQKGHNAASLINNLNPIIRGWCNSKLAWHSNRTFHKLDNYVFDLLWRWMHRTHPNKSNQWLKSKYFKHKKEFGFNNRWVFHVKTKIKDSEVDLELLQMKWFKVQRHIMIRNIANPLDSAYDDYFKELHYRRDFLKSVNILNRFDREIALDQDLKCPVCNQNLFNGEPLHKHHIIERAKGGSNTKSNLCFLHLPCHYSSHRNYEKWLPIFRSSKKSLLASLGKFPS